MDDIRHEQLLDTVPEIHEVARDGFSELDAFDSDPDDRRERPVGLVVEDQRPMFKRACDLFVAGVVGGACEMQVCDGDVARRVEAAYGIAIAAPSKHAPHAAIDAVDALVVTKLRV